MSMLAGDGHRLYCQKVRNRRHSICASKSSWRKNSTIGASVAPIDPFAFRNTFFDTADFGNFRDYYSDRM